MGTAARRRGDCSIAAMAHKHLCTLSLSCCCYCAGTQQISNAVNNTLARLGMTSGAAGRSLSAGSVVATAGCGLLLLLMALAL